MEGHPGAGAAPGGRGALWRPAGASVARERFGRRVLWPTAELPGLRGVGSGAGCWVRCVSGSFRGVAHVSVVGGVCLEAQATHTDVGIRVDARNIWWDLLPCAAERNMHGKRWLDLRNLSVHWHQDDG